MTHPPLIVIVGPTASGKSDLAMKLAQQFNGEIIAADSRTIYKGLDIGSAKPTKADQTLIKHHLLDVVSPNQAYSAARFQKDAILAVEDIYKRGKLPIMVGGSGLYIDSVIFNYEFSPAADQKLRTKLAELSLSDLQKKAIELGITEDDINFQNRRHLQRAVEAGGVKKHNRHLRENTHVIGLEINKEQLAKRISERIDAMVAKGLIEEVKGLINRYGSDNEAMTGIGYRALAKYFNGQMSLDDAIANFKRGDLLLAKKQMTWFRRNKYIHWFSDPRQAEMSVASFLNKK